MRSISPAILLVDDDAVFAQSLSGYAQASGCRMAVASSVEHASPMLDTCRMHDLILMDVELPDGNGLDLLERIAPQSLERVVVLTGDSSDETARRARRFPISDYLVKPLDAGRLRALFRRAQRNAGERHLVKAADAGSPMIGSAPGVQWLLEKLRRVAPYPDAVFLAGETGTGKDLAARALHAFSGRSGPFIAVNCAATGAELLGSQLFGHARGSFTGAIRDHRGYFEQADGGTLFLDEISDMPPTLQPYLLRVLESGAITPLGHVGERQVDVRVVAACNVDPQRAVESGRLRADLYHRLAAFPVALPPLRERTGDIAVLACFFLDALNREHGTARSFSQAALDTLSLRPWPGNIRELKGTVRRAYILTDDPVIAAEHVVGDGSAAAYDDASSPRTLEAIEQRAVLDALARAGGNKLEAAQRLGVSVKTIYNKLERYRGLP